MGTTISMEGRRWAVAFEVCRRSTIQPSVPPPPACLTLVLPLEVREVPWRGSLTPPAPVSKRQPRPRRPIHVPAVARRSARTAPAKRPAAPSARGGPEAAACCT